VVVLKQQSDEQTYQLYTEFKSHESEFDFLTSMEIEEKINQIKWFPFSHHSQSQMMMTTNGSVFYFRSSPPLPRP
jgi:serine/threonine-protein phosphatase 2A regulatory subunit B